MPTKESFVSSRLPTTGQLSWLLLFRLLVISLFLGGAILYRMRAPGASEPIIATLVFLVGFSYAQALVSAVFLKFLKPTQLMVHVQIIWDLLFVTAVIYLTGVSESIFSFLYILVIIYSAFLCSRRELLIIASASAILYGSLLDLQFYGYLPEMRGLPFATALSSRELLYQVFINVLAFFLTGLLGGALAMRLRASEVALERREVDVRELARLNQLILQNISSGLMMIEPDGRIRTFNPAAAAITGYHSGDVIGQMCTDIFPSIESASAEGKSLKRLEMDFIDSGGKGRILGYSITDVEGPNGQPQGRLITFQDLTEFKELEDKFERAQRLATVGRLASGMAHEIRNPLASISGSVQLLGSAQNLAPEDRRLMNIVVREAERLSRLLGEFLDYAKPPKPHPVQVPIGAFLDEILDLLAADPRWSGIRIHRDYGQEARLDFDKNQIRQALWNLLINAAEAMQGRGNLYVGADPGERSLCIEDDGPGIPETARDKIFDPFFTTKPTGTGLGLAMVFSTVEAHGGDLKLLEGAEGGARFVIRFP